MGGGRLPLYFTRFLGCYTLTLWTGAINVCNVLTTTGRDGRAYDKEETVVTSPWKVPPRTLQANTGATDGMVERTGSRLAKSQRRERRVGAHRRTLSPGGARTTRAYQRTACLQNAHPVLLTFYSGVSSFLPSCWFLLGLGSNMTFVFFTPLTTAAVHRSTLLLVAFIEGEFEKSSHAWLLISLSAVFELWPVFCPHCNLVSIPD